MYIIYYYYIMFNIIYYILFIIVYYYLHVYYYIIQSIPDLFNFVNIFFILMRKCYININININEIFLKNYKKDIK